MTNDNNNELPPVLNKGHIAQLLDKSERTVDRLMRAGRLPEPLVPGHPRWSRASIERWMQGGTTPRRGRR